MERVLKKRTGSKTAKENFTNSDYILECFHTGQGKIYYRSLSSGNGNGKNEKETSG